MSKENRILYAGLAIAVLIPLIFGLLLQWPMWVVVPFLAAVLYGVYRKLVHAVHTPADHVGMLMDKIGLHAKTPTRALTAHRIAKLIEASGNPRVADEIRHRYDAPNVH